MVLKLSEGNINIGSRSVDNDAKQKTMWKVTAVVLELGDICSYILANVGANNNNNS